MGTKTIGQLDLATAASAIGCLLECESSGVSKRLVTGTGGGLDADKVDGIQGTALWYSSNGTGGSDGNAGQPPAPKPHTLGTNAIGEWRQAVYSAPNTIAPPGGTWAYLSLLGARFYVGTIAGGGILQAGSDVSTTLLCWRIA